MSGTGLRFESHHLEASVVASVGLDLSHRIRVQLGAHPEDVISGAVLHEERHRQVLFSTPFGLAQYYLSLSATHEMDPLLLGDRQPAIAAGELAKISILTHEGWALACESYEMPLHGGLGPTPTGQDREALELYLSIASHLPSKWSTCVPFLYRAVADTCLWTSLLPEDLVDGLSGQMLRRWLDDRRQHPDFRLVHIATAWQRFGAPVGLDQVLSESLASIFPGDTRSQEEQLKHIEMQRTLPRPDEQLVDRADRYFSAVFEGLVRTTLNDVGVDVGERDADIANLFSSSTAEAWTKAGLSIKPMLTTAEPLSSRSWYDLLAEFSIQYKHATSIPSVELDYQGRTQDSATDQFGSVIAVFNAKAQTRWVLWVSNEFTCAIGFVPAEEDDIPKHLSTRKVMEPLIRLFVRSPVFVDELVHNMGIACIGVVTVDEFRDEGHDWQIGGMLAQALKRPVAVLVRPDDYRLASIFLEMLRRRGPIAIRPVWESRQQHFFGVLYFGVQVVFVIPSALRGLMSAFNPELGAWFEDCVSEGRASMLEYRDLVWEHQLALLLDSGIFNWDIAGPSDESDSHGGSVGDEEGFLAPP